jgi:predicted PurR-regulated permease PerM
MGTKSPHFWWIISILTTTIIALVSFILTKQTANASIIVDYISFASVILSITLSVFAILYTYTSNVQIQQQFEKINSAATSIHETSNKLISTEAKLNELLDTISTRLENIDESQREINTHLNNMNNQVDETIINNLQQTKN